ncbi:RNA polymerase factor sigma-54 [Micromonospora sp. IBHARD004]|uniref:RNA polymerase factor sigma-54 n=1 Tax=Micromonospora sp. IBHARD004 TaxID=3457764 RepID=UPI004057D3DE
MSPTFEFTMAPRLGLEVSPALIAFGEMLMLPYAALQSLVDDELNANTALERLEPGECPVCRGSWRTRCPVCAVPSRGVGPDQHRPAAEVPDSESDCQALRKAAHAETRTADAAAVDYLIDSLDQHGLFDRTCAELAAELGTTEQHVAALVGVIRRCGPPGVGATSIAECLLLQLDALGLPDDRLVRAVIAGHLPALARGHFAAIADGLGATRDEVQRALDVIRRRLRPYPAFDGRGTAAPAYVVPDAVIGADPAAPAGFRVELVEAATIRLRVRLGGPGVGAARMFLAQLRDRWETLRRVTEYVAGHQRAFLTGGPARLRPLTRSEVAAALDLHESTVSRAVAEKYVLLPDRTVTSLATFFGASGGADEALRRLLVSDRGRQSDQQLADLLREAGYPMARRTVAKHRARLGFTSAALR